MAPGVPGAPGVRAQAPVTVDPTNLWRHEAAHVLPLSPPRIPLEIPVQEQPMSSRAVLVCHPAQVHKDQGVVYLGSLG